MGDRTRWHHDLPYWPVRGSQVVTIWLAFDQVVKDNGALEFIRGSHLWGQRFQPLSAPGDGGDGPFESGLDDGLVPMPDFESERDDHEMVTFPLEPGDALAFHALTVHSSYPNRTTDRQRRGYAMRFTGEAVRYYGGPVWNVYIVNPTLQTGDRAGQRAVSSGVRCEGMMSDEAQKEALLEIHHARLKALVDGDVETLDRYVSDDMIYTSPTGETLTKAQAYDGFRSGANEVEQMDSDDIEIRLYGDAAIITYRARARMRVGKHATTGLIRSTATYIRAEIGWRLVSQHQSRIE